MKLEEILDLVGPDMPIIIYEANGQMCYIGAIQGAHTFNKLEIEHINVANNQLIITISTNDMLN